MCVIWNDIQINLNIADNIIILLIFYTEINLFSFPKTRHDFV